MHSTRWPVGLREYKERTTKVTKPIVVMRLGAGSTFGEDALIRQFKGDQFSGSQNYTRNASVVSETETEVFCLLIFSNSQYKHHVTRVVGKDRYALSFWYNSSTNNHQSD